nr:hypothetical protein [Modestobacter caceresii]
MIVVIEGGDHADSARRSGLQNQLRGGGAAHARHPQVHEDDVRDELVGQPDRLAARPCLTDDLDVRLRLAQHPQAGPDEVLVVDQ